MTSPTPPKKTVKIIATNDIPAIDPGRIGETDVLITYRIGPIHSGQFRIPKKEFTEKRLKQELKKDVELHAKYVNAEYEL